MTKRITFIVANPREVLILLLICFFTASCTSTAPTESRLMKESPNVTVSAPELRVKVRALAPRFSGIIETAADQIMRQTNDPEHHSLALRWKVTGVPSIQAALFQPDPLAAVMDTWTLIVQTRFYLEEGPGTQIPPEARKIGLSAALLLEKEIIEFAVSISTPEVAAAFHQRVVKWARKHPVENFSTRQSPAGDLAHLTAGSQMSAFKAVGNMTETMDDLIARVDLYNQYLPKQARWQAELLMVQGLYYSGIRDSLEDVAAIPQGIEGISEKISAERDFVLSQLIGEKDSTLEWIQGERLDVQDFIVRERLAVMDILAQERGILLATVEQERLAVFDAVHQERIAALQDVERMSNELLTDPVKGLIDYAFVRAAQLLGGVLLTAAL
ncbi:MAG: hypothetical protein GY906_18515, partial [bacterium]|nr:hypothetical protein [bacterium]